MDADVPELRSVAMHRALAPNFYVPAAEQEQPALSLIDAS
jgi:hypothetical protein